MLGAALLAAYALWSVIRQDQANHRFVPVDCTILSAQIERHSGKHTTYSPEVHYSYTYKDHAYESTRILPISESGERSWAQGILRQVDPSGTAGTVQIRGIEAPAAHRSTAYINPLNPSESILIRQYSFTPYLLSMAFLVATGIGAGLCFGFIGGALATMKAVPLDDRLLLLPTRNLRQRARQAWSWLFWIALSTLPLSIHWLMVAGIASAIVPLFVVLLVLVCFATIAVRRRSIARHLSDARLLVKPAPMVRGTPFLIELESDAYSPLRVKSATACLVCTEHYKEKRGNKTSYGTRKHAERKVPLCTSCEVPPGQLLTGKGELLVAEGEYPPTTDVTVKLYPYYTWAVRVDIELDGLVDYQALFPLTVE
jgi:hypothetical protein